MARPRKRRIEYIAVADLQGAPRNVKAHADDLIGGSIGRFGMMETIVLDERTQRIVAGHGRRDELLRREQAGEVPPDGITVGTDSRWLVPVTRGWASASDEEADAAAIALNRIGEVGGWQRDLGVVLAELAASPLGLDGLGFAPPDLDNLPALMGWDDLGNLEPEVKTHGDPDDAPPLDAEPPIAQPGDLWLLGDHRLYVGDATDPVSYAAVLDGDGGPVDMVWTDPPYGVAYEGAAGTIDNDEIDADKLAKMLHAAFGLAAEACRPGAVWIVAAPAGPHFAVFAAELGGLGIWRQTLLWLKDALVLGRSDYHYRHEALFYGWTPGAAHTRPPDRAGDTVWEFPRPRRSETHPTMKPVGLVARALANHTSPNDLVLDPFAGSGTTLVAAHRGARRARLIELDGRYADVICRRYAALTGEPAVLARTGAPYPAT